MTIDSVKKIDPQQITNEFMRDFEKLLRRYDATFEVCDGIAEIDFNGIYDMYNNEIRPYINLPLPNYINPK